MNQGIARASGDLLWFMHSGDCFSDPDAVAAAVWAISGHGPARELWGYGMDNLVGLGRVRGPMPFSIRKFLAGLQVIPHQTSFFGASLVSKLGGYDLDFGIAEDQEFMLRAALLREPITIRRVFCDFDTTESEPIGPRALSSAICVACGICVHGRYPFGGRRASRAYLRCWEYYLSGVGYVFGLIQSRRSESPRG